MVLPAQKRCKRTQNFPKISNFVENVLKRMNKPGIIYVLTGLLTLLASGAACTGRKSGSADPHLRITVAIEPQRQLVEAIAGDRARVTSLLAGGDDPETYDPTLTTLTGLNRSDAYFKLGTLEFENRLIDRLGGSMPPVYDASRGIRLMEGSHSGETDHDHDHGHGHEGHVHEFDPHIWSSVRNAKVMAANYAEALTALDPAGADYYSHRLDSVTAELGRIDSIFTAALASSRGRAFMVWHPSLSYFAEDYGLRQLAVGSENKEITIPGLNRTIEDALKRGVNIFFSQPGYDPRLSATVRSHLDAECVEVNVLAYDWIAQLRAAVKALSANQGD